MVCGSWKKVKLFILYFFLVAGGLWHLLDLFQVLMKLLASPLIIGLGLWLTIENLWLNRNSKAISPNSRRLIGWSLSVIILTIVIEGIGVKSGKIFGSYGYGSYLSPYIWGVPLAIGFAWLTMLLSSIPLAEWILTRTNSANIIFTAILSALFMSIFDFFMEPAAVKLGYWSWLEGEIPWRNYLAWFVISFFLVISAKLLKILPQKFSTLGIHAYFAQLIYFLMVNWS